MRIFIGIIVGIILTIGTAYIADTMRPAPGTGPGTSTEELATRPMVNWDVVDYNMRSISSRVQDAWGRLTGRKSNDG